MPLLLYTLTAAALLWLAHRFVRPISRWAALVLFLIPFTFFGDALVTSKIVAPVDLPYQTVPLSWMKAQYGVEEISPGFHSDVYTEFVPWRHVLRWSFANGEWGLRDPFALSGDVLLAAQQSAPYWPLTLIALLMPAALSFTYTGATTLLIAALCMFLLARELDCGEPAALIGAAGWALSMAMLAFALVTMSATWAWCPLLLAAVRRVIATPNLRTGALLTFVFAVLLFSSHPESAVLSILIGLLYAIRKISLRAIFTAITAGAIALLLCAIHLLPFLEAMPQSAEHAHRAALGAIEAPRPTETLARVASSFIPYLHGRRWAAGFEWFDTGVAGSVILALAIFAVIRRAERRRPGGWLGSVPLPGRRDAAVPAGEDAGAPHATWFFAALALFSLLGHAKWPPLVTAMQAVPVLNIALTDRLSFGFALSLCVLAAIGAQQLTRRAAIVMVALLAFLALGSWWAVHTPLVTHDFRRYGDHGIAAELIALALAAAIVIWRPRATALLLGLVIAQRAVTEYGIYKSFDQRQAYPPIPIFEAIDKPGRITGHGNALIPHTASMYGLEDVRGFPALTNRRYAETFPLWCIPQPVFYNRVDDLTRPFLSFLNVRYAITWDRDPPPPGWREVARQPGAILLENTSALDRAFVPPAVRFGPWTDMLGETDFAQRAWIEADLPPGERTNGPGRVTIRDARLGYVIDAEMENDGWIVTSITAWKGWRAYIDGRRVKTQFANHAFIGVHVPRGKHRVELRYWPESFVRGAGITAITLIAVIGFALFHRL